MASPADQPSPAADARAPRAGLQIMALVLVAIGLVAIYANVQRARESQIETVTIAPAPSQSPTLPQPASP